jgi:GH24 family phage-related lysozyme (muramidase)
LVSFTRTVTNPKGYNLEPEGRANSLDKIYVGFVKYNNDSQTMGRLKVWIPELGGDPGDEDQWVTVSYASPFAGATSVYDNKNGSTWEDTQRSYGWWAVPPDLENEVLCCFINGDPGRGIWFACLYQQAMNQMVPGIGGTDQSKGLPIAEYNKTKEGELASTAQGPEYTPLADALRKQGLENDAQRGTSNSSAKRQTPRNSVYGFLSPGGHQLVIDDNPDSSFIRLRTKQGTQVLVNDNEGFVYINSGSGKAWLEISNDGDIQAYGAGDISLRAQGSMNLRGDLDVNIEAGRSIYMIARGETTNTKQFAADQLTTVDTSNGQVQTATTTASAKYPPIGINDTSLTITIPSDTITGNFVQGMKITGVDLDNPSTNAAPNSSTVNTSPSSTTNSFSNGADGTQKTVIVGDSIGLGTGQALGKQRGDITTIAKVGATSSAVVNSIQNSPQAQNADQAVISVGSNDIVNGKGNVGKLTTNMEAIRGGLNSKKYIWILPTDPLARNTVQGFANSHGDETVDFQPGADGIHPQNYNTIANDVNNKVNQYPANTSVPGNVTTFNTNLNQTPDITLSSVSADGNNTILGVTFSAGLYSQFGSNASTITGTLQNDTTPVEAQLDNNNSTLSGRIMMQALNQFHITSGDSMWLSTGGSLTRHAGGNMFDLAKGSYDIGAGGYLAVGSNGALSIGSASRIYQSAPRIDLNGDQAQSPQSGAPGLGPISADRRDVQVVGETDRRIILRQTILGQFPTHEPYDGHNNSSAGTDGYVEPGNLNLRTGTVVTDQDKPLNITGQPTPNSPPGYYTGQGFDSKGSPQYRFEGASNDLKPAGSLQLSQAGYEFVRKAEGVRSTVYPDAAQFTTVGIGHKLKPDEAAGKYVLLGETKRYLAYSPLTDQEIQQLFQQDAEYFQNWIRKNITKPITQTQFDMLFSLIFNVGPGNMRSVAAKINAGDYNVNQEWMRLNHIRKNGQLIEFPPLTKRRREEYAYFSKGTPINPATV